MDRVFFVIGAVSAGLAVALGAFGAHGLRARLSPDLAQTFETAARYHIYHALALFVVALGISRWGGSGWALAAGWLFIAGTVLFSGSLYVLAVSGVRWLGAVAPLGGLALLAAWVCLAVAAWRG